ncbi:MAG: hypothetical protein MUF61_03240, partial [archaeon]|nr:hypothetical protein [archaeon]
NEEDRVELIDWAMVVGYKRTPEYPSFDVEIFARNIASLCKIGRMSQYLRGNDGKTITYSVFDKGELGRQEHNPLIPVDSVPEEVKDSAGRPKSKHAYFTNPQDAQDYIRALMHMQEDTPNSKPVEYEVRPNAKEGRLSRS